MNDISLPINQLAGRGVGHNSTAAPLAEVLAEELAPAKSRAEELLASAQAARIESAADAARVADLIAFCRDLERSVDRERNARKRPLMMDCRIIEVAFGAVIGPLARARTDTLAPMLDAWSQDHEGAALPTSVAAVGSRREIQFCIEDLPAAVGWLLQNHGGAMAQACRTIIGSLLKSAGVNTVESDGIKMPGVTIFLKKSTVVR